MLNITARLKLAFFFFYFFELPYISISSYLVAIIDFLLMSRDRCETFRVDNCKFHADEDVRQDTVIFVPKYFMYVRMCDD